MNTSIILMGIKHCGKTTVGRSLETATGLPFYDLDTVIESDCGMTVRELYRTRGKEAFCEAEAAAARSVAAALTGSSVHSVHSGEHSQSRAGAAIIATGGGICDNHAALAELAAIPRAVTVFLEIDEATAFARIHTDYKREGTWPAYIARENPATTEDAARVFHAFYERRRAAYKKICGASVLVEQKTPLMLAEEIIELAGR